MLTSAGPIEAELVVNAAGIWAPQIAAMAGAFITSTPVDHQHAALRAVPGHELPGDMPCFRDPDNLVYGKSEHGGMLFGGYEAEPNGPLARRRPVGPRGDVAAAGLRALRAADRRGRRCASRSSPTRRCRPRLPPRRDDAGREPAPRADARGARLLGGRGAVAQRVRRRRRDRPGDRGLDHGRRPGRRRRAVSGVAVRRHVPRSAVGNGDGARGVRRLLPAALSVRRRRGGRPRRLSALHGRLQETGAVFGVKAGFERADYHEPGPPWRRAGPDQRAWGWTRPPFLDRLIEECRAVRERVGLIDLSSFGKIAVEGRGRWPSSSGSRRTTSTGPIGSLIYTPFLEPERRDARRRDRHAAGRGSLPGRDRRRLRGGRPRLAPPEHRRRRSAGDAAGRLRRVGGPRAVGAAGARRPWRGHRWDGRRRRAPAPPGPRDPDRPGAGPRRADQLRRRARLGAVHDA